MNKSSKAKGAAKLLLVMGLMLITLTACPPQFPLKIKDVSVYPKPKIGQTITLRVEIISTRAEQDVTVWVDLPEGVKLMSGQKELKGSLIANQAKTYEIELCVLYAGDWRIEIGAYSMLSENNGYEDQTIIYFVTTAKTARILNSGQHNVTQPPDGIRNTPTPMPPPPAGICN